MVPLVPPESATRLVCLRLPPHQIMEQGHPILHSLEGGPLYLREQIGSGGTSTVWRALLPPSTFYAVKVVRATGSSAIEAKKLDREFRIHQTLRHRNILEIVAAERRGAEESKGNSWPEGLYIAMQLGAFTLEISNVGVRELTWCVLVQRPVVTSST